MSLLSKRQERAWDPFKDLREMSDRLNQAFALEPFLPRGHEGQALMGNDWAPSVNISETDKAYLIRADLPEVKKEDVKVTCDNGVLTIEGERKQQKTEDNERYHRVESSYGRFLRRFTLPDDADEGTIEANFKDGGLTVKLPRAAGKPSKSRQVKIS
jgi:HSP20 family protein